MANVLAFFGVLFIFAVCYPPLLLVIWHTQRAAARAHDRLLRMPRRCVALGFVIAMLIAAPALVLFSSASGAVQLIGWLMVAGVLGLSAIGASGLAALLGARIRPDTPTPVLVGAVVLALASFFPVLGWLFALPTTLFASLGASTMAMVSPQPERVQTAVATPATAQVQA